MFQGQDLKNLAFFCLISLLYLKFFLSLVDWAYVETVSLWGKGKKSAFNGHFWSAGSAQKLFSYAKSARKLFSVNIEMISAYAKSTMDLVMQKQNKYISCLFTFKGWFGNISHPFEGGGGEHLSPPSPPPTPSGRTLPLDWSCCCWCEYAVFQA